MNLTTRAGTGCKWRSVTRYDTSDARLVMLQGVYSLPQQHKLYFDVLVVTRYLNMRDLIAITIEENLRFLFFLYIHIINGNLLNETLLEAYIYNVQLPLMNI